MLLCRLLRVFVVAIVPTVIFTIFSLRNNPSTFIELLHDVTGFSSKTDEILF